MIRPAENITLSVVLLLSLRFHATAQQAGMKFDHLTVEDGLSSLTVLTMAQDGEGYLWFGTDDGLDRYDGYGIRSYRAIRGDSTALASSGCLGLTADPGGNLWITGALDVLHRYDRQKDSFVRYKINGPEAMPSNIQFGLGAITADQMGRIWMASNFGVGVFDPRTRKTEYFIHDSTDSGSLTGNAVTVICVANPGTIWIGTSNGINRLDPVRGSVRRFSSRNNSRLNPQQDAILSIATDKSGTIWAGTFGGLLRYDPKTESFLPFSGRTASGFVMGTEMFITSLLCGTDGTLWIGTMHQGLIRLDPRTGVLSQHRHDDTNPKSIDSDRITCLLEDRSGVFWAATYRVGVNKYDRRRDPFVHYPVKAAVYSILEDTRGSLWLGTTGALYRFSQGVQTPEIFAANTERSSGLRGPEIYSFLGDPGGNIWVGSNAGLERYSMRTGRFTLFDFKRPTKPNNPTVKTILRDRDGTLWLGTYVPELIHFDPATGSSVIYRHNPDDQHSVPAGEVWSLFRDSKNRLWIGTFGGGLGLYDDKTDSFSVFIHSQSDTNSISSNVIYSITEDITGLMWLGMFGSGLNSFDPEKGKWTVYTVQDGLPDNFVKTVTADHHGNLWLSTDKGLSYFNPGRRIFRNFTENDGLHGNVFLSGSVFRTDDGRLFFGGMNGVTSFHPDSLKPKYYVPPVLISNFKVLERNTPLPADDVPEKRVELAYNENSFSFEFVALDYSLPEKNQYAYMLDGLDNDWINAGTRRYASYTKVPPGDYRFRVKGSNSDGIWNEDEASLTITVIPPLWQTWWFRLLAVVIVIGAVAFVYQYRVNRLLEIERLRVRIASDLHDDIGSSLTKISLQSELIQEGIDPGEQQNYLKNIARMSRELVTSMGDIVWSIDARNDSVESLLDKMRSFGSATLSALDIDFVLSSSGLDQRKKIPVDVRENIYLIFKEAIHNITKHSAASTVEVRLENSTDGMQMIIRDNGMGWEGTARPSGHGTKNMRMRADRLQGTLEIRKENGTLVVLRTRPL